MNDNYTIMNIKLSFTDSLSAGVMFPFLWFQVHEPWASGDSVVLAAEKGFPLQTLGFILLREAVIIFTGPRGMKWRQRNSHMHGTFLHGD